MKRAYIFGAIALFLFSLLTAMEFFTSDDPVTLSKLFIGILETFLLVSTVVAAVFMSIETRELRLERHDLISDLATARAEGERWRNASRAYIEGLGQAIQTQFKEWNLTGAEADVAALMLKGLAQKEIAHIRKATAATIRQQAGSVYQKSGLSSRAELAAFFLEDLLPPNQL